MARLVQRWSRLDSPWQVALAGDVLALPGVGLTVPDLAFTHRETGEVVYLEVLGFWSREAVWRRVELVEAGLPSRIVFAVSSTLRVSQDVLDDDKPAALYVFKRSIEPKAVLERLNAVAARRPHR